MIVPNIQQIKIDIDKTYLRKEHLWTVQNEGITQEVGDKGEDNGLQKRVSK